MLPVSQLENEFLLDEEELDEELVPNLTYRLNEENCTVREKIDVIEAIKQSLSLILQTERMEYEIYSEDYGAEMVDLIGQAPPLVYVNIEDEIKEALLQDDRVESVDEFNFERSGNDVMVQFKVVTVEGDFDMEKEVTLYG